MTLRIREPRGRGRALAENESPVGAGYARTRDIVLLALLLVVMAAALVVVLVQAWPPTPRLTADGRLAPGFDTVTADLFGWSPRLSRESALFVIVMTAGALGAVVHALRSLYWYVGNRTLRRSWLMMYMFLPFIGALFGLMVYLVLRGGLTSPTGGSSDVNPYGVTAIAALVGLFSQETAEKLRAIFAIILAQPRAGRDQAVPPQIHSVEPASGTVGSLVVIRGVGLRSASAVRFGTADAPLTEVSDTRVLTVVPPGAASARLTITTPTGPVTSPAEFTVT
jgi:hypothetical protein